MITLGVVIATPGRASLLRTINSIQNQGLIPGDDILIVGDGYHKQTAELVELIGPPFRYVATTKTRDWGHSQINYGLKHVKGDWLVLQDDDDIFLPRAFDEIRRIVGELRQPEVIIGRVMSPYLGLLWRAPGAEPLDGHCLVVPNNKEKLGYVGSEYAGDQVWLKTNIEAYENYTWADRCWTLTRPEWKLWPSLARTTEVGSIWSFSRSYGSMGVGLLSFTWDAERKKYWANFAPDPDEKITAAEYNEIGQFAAWAGQGNDVWFTADPDNEEMIEGLLSFNYEWHQKQGDYGDLVHEWPARRFVPPEEKK